MLLNQQRFVPDSVSNAEILLSRNDSDDEFVESIGTVIYIFVAIFDNKLFSKSVTCVQKIPQSCAALRVIQKGYLITRNGGMKNDSINLDEILIIRLIHRYLSPGSGVSFP